MNSRWYNVAVIVLWLASMGWLVSEKILPPLLVGKPPSYKTIVADDAGLIPAGWKLWVRIDNSRTARGDEQKGQPMGWAISSTERLPNETTEIHSLVHFERIPLEQLIPVPLRALLPAQDLPMSKMEMQVESLLMIDPLGQLSGFDSVLRAKPRQEVIKMGGIVKGNQLEITIQAGTLSYPPVQVPLPDKSLVGDALSPQTRLPNLGKGQTWRVPAYSLYRPNDPIENLQATVEDLTHLVWNQGTEKTWLVVYRADPTLGLRGDKSIRGKLWVRKDGTVLQQQVKVLNATLTFLRLSDQEAIALHEQHAQEVRQRATGGRPGVVDR